MSRRAASAALLLGLATPALATNIIVVVIDDLGTDKVPSYLTAAEQAQASFLPTTPTIDALSAAGLRFSHAWANPVCSPSRATFITGDYASTHTVGDNVAEGTTNPELPEGLSLASDLRDAGYATALFGKWHLGFTGVNGTTDWSSSTTCPTETTIADEQNPMLHGFDYYQGEIHVGGASYVDWYKGTSPGDGTTGACEETVYHDEIVVDTAVDWIADRWDAGTGTMAPYFAFVSLKAVHTDGDGGGRHNENDIPPSVVITEPCLQDGVTNSCGDADGDGEDDEERMIFQLLVEGTDAAVNDLLEGIDAIGDGALDDTLVILWGDNGTTREIMEPPFTSSAEYGKGTMYESGIKVPLTVTDAAAWKALREGRRPPLTLIARPGREVSRPVLIADLYDTILAATGATASHATDGESFAACFTSTSPTCGYGSIRPMWAEQYRIDGSGIRSGQGAWRNSSLKVQVEYQRDATCINPTVYDLNADPYELTDLYATLSPARARGLKRSVGDIDAPWFPHESTGQTRWCR